MYSYIIDFIILVITIASVIDGFKKGFLRSIILLVGYVLAIFIAIRLGDFLSKFIFDQFIYQNIVDDINRIIPSDLGTLDLGNILNDVTNALPTFVVSLMMLNFGGVDGLSTAIDNTQSFNGSNLSTVLVDTVIAPTIIPFLQAIICLISFIVLIFVVKLVANIFKGVNRIPIIGFVNSLLGGVIGIVQAIAVIYLLGFVASLIISITSNELSYLNESIIEKTYLFKLIYAKFI